AQDEILGRETAQAVDALLIAISDKDSKVRAHAAVALDALTWGDFIKIDALSGSEILDALTHETDLFTRSYLFEALAHAGSDASWAKSAVSQIAADLKQDDPRSLEDGIGRYMRALGKMGSADADTAFNAVLPFVRGQVLGGNTQVRKSAT